MRIRYYIPGILWILVMGLLFFTPLNDPPHTLLGVIPSRSVMHGVLFLGCVHIWIGACKKQLTKEMIRRKAVPLVYLASIALAIIGELIIFITKISPETKFILWNLLFDVAGASLGILTFKLLYRHCY